MPCPPHFSLRVSFGEVSLLNVTFVTFCVKSFSCQMLHIALLMLKEFGVVSLILIFYRFLLQKRFLAFCKFLETAKDC